MGERADSRAKVTLLADEMRALDGAYDDGGTTPWSGDQTLWELPIVEGDQRRDMLFLVARGDAFIPADIVARHVRRLIAPCDPERPVLPQLEQMADPPGAGRRPHIRLAIDPGAH